MDAWVPVVGTLGGAIIGAGITWLIERDRRSHERQSRWVAERRNIYATVIRAADTYEDEVYEWVRRSNAALQKSIPSQEIGKWPETGQFEAACYEAELLAPMPVLLSLVEIRRSVYATLNFRREARAGGKRIEYTALDEQYKLYDKNRQRFLKAARDDLGVASPDDAEMAVAIRRWRRIRRPRSARAASPADPAPADPAPDSTP